MRPMHRQKGWVGLVVVLLALVIVGVLTQTLLKRSGLLPEERTISKSGTRGPGPTAAVPIDATGATPTPGKAMERARGLESAVQQQSQDMVQRIESQTK